MRLENKVALITGAGAGIGREIALLFASVGARVVVSDIAGENVSQVVQQIAAAGGTATGVVADVAREDEVNRMVDTAVETYGRLDVLVNNAGVVDRIVPAGDLETDLWRRVLAINLDGPFYACRRALGTMVSQGSGVIVNVASVAGVAGGRGGAAYTTSKHGLIGLTKSIAQFYGSKGIRCNVLCPGAIGTGISLGGVPHDEGLQRLMKINELNPRVAAPREIAEVALFLASDAASFVNGATLVADGGWTAL